MFTVTELYSSPLTDKLAIAHRLSADLRSTLLAEPGLEQGLINMQDRAGLLRDHMLAMKMYVHCLACAGKKGGGCCSEFMSNENDAVQLLLNLLAGTDVAFQRDDGYECPFLGPAGCILQFKPMFCLNYNCRQIVQASPPAQMAILQRFAGSLLQEQYRLEQLVLEVLRRAAVLC